MRIFDQHGAPYSYQHLARLAPDGPPEQTVNGRLYAEITVTDHPTTASSEAELIAELVQAYNLRDADVLDFDDE